MSDERREHVSDGQIIDLREEPARVGVDESLLPPIAPTVLSKSQKVAFLVVATALVVSVAIRPTGTVIVVNSVLVMFFIVANVSKLALVNRSLSHRHDTYLDLRDHALVADEDLPIYTVLLPLFREAAVLPQLVEGVVALDYPIERLDVKLLLEEDDADTRAAVAQVELPPCFEILIVPDVGPRGKPRACNHGLASARGEYLVIFDAEDRPEPHQLRQAVTAFRTAQHDVVCLQAKLNYFNRTHNVLTRWFTSEYSVWFDQLLPGLQSLDAPIPLGGTSNHIVTARLRELGGWNAYNVTEDADLGLRIFLRGWKTAILDSTTYEEATSRYGNWIRQRSRWVKGYMQTYLFHMRHPARLMRRMGVRPFVLFQLFFGAATLCLVLNPLYWMLVAVWYATHVHLLEIVFPTPLLYGGTLALFFGNGACVLAAVAGTFERRNYDDVKWAFLVPIYWLLMSVAALKALIQLFLRPTYWEKTDHGHCRFEDGQLDQPVDVAAVAAALSADVAG